MAKRIEIGNKHNTAKAKMTLPDTLTQAASITISDNTPAFTALPIFGPIGLEIAVIKGLKT
ncbi:MAG: hypothetical protein MUF45_06840 [Spirosomaceae bacterium]|nr:hypothetical protein [Spirosomataceae bacterium]